MQVAGALLFALGALIFAITYVRFLFDHHNEFIGWSMLVAVVMMAAGWWLMQSVPDGFRP